MSLEWVDKSKIGCSSKQICNKKHLLFSANCSMMILRYIFLIYLLNEGLAIYMVIKEETMINLSRIRRHKASSFSVRSSWKKRKKQAIANSLIPPRGNVYSMLNRKVNTKGKIVK